MDVNLQTYTNSWSLISAKIVDNRLQLQAGISQHHTLTEINIIIQNFVYLFLLHVHTHTHTSAHTHTHTRIHTWYWRRNSRSEVKESGWDETSTVT